MCLNIKSGPHSAKKDFYVLKMMENLTESSCFSLFRSYKYEYGSIHKSDFLEFRNKIENGLHSLLVKDIHESGWGFAGARYFYHGGHLGSDFGLVLCKIPKGAVYFLGDDGDVCSDILEVLFPVISTKENSNAIGDGVNTPHLNRQEFFKMAAQWVIDAGYNIKPS